MRTLGPLMIVLSFVVAVTLLTGSGAIDHLGGTGFGESDAQEDVQDLSKEKNISGEAASNEGSIVGLVVGAARDVAGFFALVAYFPSVLSAIGMPQWLANPLGWIAQLVAFVGFGQFVTGRFYE